MIECRFCGCVFVSDLDLKDHLDACGNRSHKRDLAHERYLLIVKNGSSFPKCPCSEKFVRDSKACLIKIGAGVCGYQRKSDDIYSLLGENY